MTDEKKVLQFPPLKQEREALEQSRAQIEEKEMLASRFCLALTPSAFLTIEDNYLQLRNKDNVAVGSYPVHKYDEFFLRQSVVAQAQVDLLEDALKAAGINVEEILTDEKITEHLKTHYTRPDD